MNTLRSRVAYKEYQGYQLLFLKQFI